MSTENIVALDLDIYEEALWKDCEFNGEMFDEPERHQFSITEINREFTRERETYVPLRF